MALIHGKDFIDGDDYYGDCVIYKNFIDQLKYEHELELTSKLLKPDSELNRELICRFNEFGAKKC
jgi:hypothetical protein